MKKDLGNFFSKDKEEVKKLYDDPDIRKVILLFNVEKNKIAWDFGVQSINLGEFFKALQACQNRIFSFEAEFYSKYIERLEEELKKLKENK